MYSTEHLEHALLERPDRRQEERKAKVHFSKEFFLLILSPDYFLGLFKDRPFETVHIIWVYLPN